MSQPAARYRQVAHADRCERRGRRRGTRREDGLPLKISSRRTLDRRAGRRSVRARPVAPGFVRTIRVSTAREHGDRAGGFPSNRSPARARLGVAWRREERAWCRQIAADQLHAAGICRRQQQASARAHHARDLARIDAIDQDVGTVRADAEQVPVGVRIAAFKCPFSPLCTTFSPR